MTIIRWALLIGGAYAWGLCLHEQYSPLVGLAAATVAASLYTVLGSEVKSKISQWSSTMIVMFAGGAIPWYLGIPYDAQLLVTASAHPDSPYSSFSLLCRAPIQAAPSTWPATPFREDKAPVPQPPAGSAVFLDRIFLHTFWRLVIMNEERRAGATVFALKYVGWHSPWGANSICLKGPPATLKFDR